MTPRIVARGFLGLMLLLPVAAGAAERGYSLSVGLWDYSIDGTLSDGSSRIDLFEQNEPGLDVQFVGDLPFQFWGEPAVRARYLDAEARSDERFSNTASVLGVPVSAGASEVDLDIDVAFYDLYLIWTWGEQLFASAGGGVKIVDADADVRVVTTTTTSPAPLLPPTTTRQVDEADEEFGFTIPALYGGVGWQAGERLAVLAEVDGMSDGENRFLAGQAMVRFKVWQHVGIDAGWRLIDIEGEAGGGRLDVQSDGPFISLLVSFGAVPE